MTDWSTKDIPSQNGKIAVITGATGGLGLETALGLAGAGAEVVVTGRNPDKGAAALGPSARPTPTLTSATNPSTPRASQQSAPSPSALPPRPASSTSSSTMPASWRCLSATRPSTASSCSSAPTISATSRSRRSSCRCLAPHAGASFPSPASRLAQASIHFDDLQAEKTYRTWEVYGQSKLACLMFGLELQRRSNAGGWGITSVIAHPGVSSTNLIENGMGAKSLGARFKPLVQGILFQPPSEGALPQLYAATMPGVVPGGYYGPDGFMELRGKPKLVTPVARARDEAAAARLWEISEQLTSQHFPRAQACGVKWRRDRHRPPLPARAQTRRTAAPPRGHPRGGGGAVRRRRSAGRRAQRHRGQGRLHQVQPLPLLREPRGCAPQPLPRRDRKFVVDFETRLAALDGGIKKIARVSAQTFEAHPRLGALISILSTRARAERLGGDGRQPQARDGRPRHADRQGDPRTAPQGKARGLHLGREHARHRRRRHVADGLPRRRRGQRPRTPEFQHLKASVERDLERVARALLKSIVD